LVQDELVARGFDVTTADEFAALAPGDRDRLLAEVEVVFGPGKDVNVILEVAPRLKIISLASSGYESVDIVAATAREIVITNAPTQMATESVADLAFALLLTVARDITTANQRLQRGEWFRPLGTAVWGKTLGIIGFGRIGAAVGRRARGFEMDVLVAAHHATNPLAHAINAEGVTIEELYARSDFVSLHSRYCLQTHHIVGRSQLQLMKPTAYLINTARAGLVDGAALLEALDKGWIAGAGLDVFDNEAQGDNPLFNRPGVVATPHIGNRTREGVLDAVRCSIDNAVAVLQGETPRFAVNPSVYR
jgi:glyoxylate reductase